MTARKVKLSQMITLLLALSLLAVLGFGIFYVTRQPPAPINRIATLPELRSNQPPRFLGNISGPEPGAAMNGPLSVAVDGRGKVYVADSGNHRVQVYDPNGRLLLQFGELGSGEGQLNYPNAIAVNRGLVYVAEVNNLRIQVFDSEGRFVRFLNQETTGLPMAPLALAFDEGGNLYVANRSGEVFILDPEGKAVGRFARPGALEGHLSYPNGIAVGGGKIYVADSGNARVQVFDREGKLLQVGNVGLSLPRGIGLDSRGRLYVVDTFGNFVAVYDQDFRLQFTFGKRGLENGELNFPNQLAMGPGDKVYVADRENNRVAVFGY